MKKLIICLIALLILVFAFSIVYALPGKMQSGANDFISKASGNYDTSIAPTIKEFSGLFLGIGVIVAIVTGLIIAIKTMTDGAFGKAELKEALTPYLIGCIVLFGAWGIWAAVVNIFQ